jgi:hypothetical protein
MRPADFLDVAGAAIAAPPFTVAGRLVAAIGLMLFAQTAHAQVVPGDSPNMGVGAAAASRPTGVGGLSRSRVAATPRDDFHGEQQYREVLKGIPNKKASKDPWATMRTTSPPDRHRAQ